MDLSPLGYLIPIVAIAGGITYAILSSYWKAKSRSAGAEDSADLRKALDSSTAANLAVVARLDAFDTRLSTVEKTLTDIP
jgi:hypothetical protein